MLPARCRSKAVGSSPNQSLQAIGTNRWTKSVETADKGRAASDYGRTDSEQGTNQGHQAAITCDGAVRKRANANGGIICLAAKNEGRGGATGPDRLPTTAARLGDTAGGGPPERLSEIVRNEGAYRHTMITGR